MAQLGHRRWDTASNLMPVYQCLFFSAGVTEYLENLKCESHGAGLASLMAKISEGEWDAAGFWSGHQLIHTLSRPG